MMAMPHIVMQAMPHPGGAPVMQVQQIPMQTIQVQQNSMQAVLILLLTQGKLVRRQGLVKLGFN